MHRDNKLMIQSRYYRIRIMYFSWIDNKIYISFVLCNRFEAIFYYSTLKYYIFIFFYKVSF